jgi:DNA-binding transcriptional MocR family regulator
MEDNFKSHYAVITAEILYCEKLNARQKLLFAVITNMSNHKGYCFASNKHISDITGTSTRTVQRDLTALENLGFIGRIVKVDANGNVLFRGIRPMTYVSPPHDTDVTTPHDMGVTIKTNFSKNKKKNNYNNVITDKENQFRFFDWVERDGLNKVYNSTMRNIENGNFPPSTLLPKQLLKMLLDSGCEIDKGRVKQKHKTTEDYMRLLYIQQL